MYKELKVGISASGDMLLTTQLVSASLIMC